MPRAARSQHRNPACSKEEAKAPTANETKRDEQRLPTEHLLHPPQWDTPTQCPRTVDPHQNPAQTRGDRSCTNNK